MADPVLRPLKWNPEFHVYAEQHGLFDVLMETLRELSIWKPSDPLVFIRDEIPRIGKCIYAPRVLILGEHPAIEIGRNLAESTGAQFLTLEDIVTTAPEDVRSLLLPVLYNEGDPDLCLSSLLAATINRRVAMTDCMSSGYVIHGFPRSQAEAMTAQQNGLIPRQVFILLPEGIMDPEEHASPVKLTSKLSISHLKEKSNYLTMKDIGAAYNSEKCRVIPFDRWMTTKQSDLEAEFLGQIIARKPAGAPWIPKIAIVGPPGAGKSLVSEHLVDKFNVVRVNWMETVRGMSKLEGLVSEECKLYLENLTPLSEETIRMLLDKKLNREDCQKKGYVLEGFPENAHHAKIMEDLCLTANRVLMVSVTESEAHARMGERRKAIYSRRLPYLTKLSQPEFKDNPDDQNMYTNPHSAFAVQQRFDQFNRNLEDLVAFFGSRIVYIDGTQPQTIVKEYAEASVVRPPTLRF